MDQTNPVFIGQWKGLFANRFALLSALAGLGAVLVWCRAWADLVLLAWATVLVLRMPFVQGWYGVVLAAWLAAPIGVLDPRRAVHVSYVRVIAWLAFGMVVFGDQTIWRWLATLFR